MAQWVDFEEIKAQVSIEQILAHYDLLDMMIQKGNQLIGLCPFHKNSTPSFKVTPSMRVWNCFGCNLGGDVIDIVRHKEEFIHGERKADRRKAALCIAEWFGIALKQSLQKSKQKSVKEPSDADVAEQTHNIVLAHEEDTPINPPLKFPLNNLDSKHQYFSERGLTQDTVDFFGLGYHAGRGIMAKRIAIPIHDAQGTLVGYAGRWPGDSGWPKGEEKYKVPSRKNGFYKSHLLFNLHRARWYASDGLIVVEGFFSVFELHQKNCNNVVAVMGNTLSKEQERLIVETVGPRGKVLIAFDQDEAGFRGMQDAAVRLAPQVFVRITVL